MRTIVLQFFLMLFLASGLPAASANPANAEQITVNRASIVYATRAGDTLMSIAERFTTRIDNWHALSKTNNIGSDTAIPIGTPITIPADLLQDEPSEARVIALSGSITASSQEGKQLLLGLGAKITEGMQIDTGNNSFLTLELPDQSRISLPSNSRIRIAKLRMARYTKSPRTEILLLNGKIESRVAPLEQNKGRFEVRTPMAVAGVRGTQFRVGFGANGMATEVLSGKVEVARPNSRDKQNLHGGQGNITNARTVGKPVELLPTPQLAGAPVRQDQNGAQFVLTPVAGAQAYHVQVATDQEAKNIILEGHAKGTRMKLDGLPNGSYYARVSAIDKLGLEGPASTHAFTLGAAQPAASGPAPAAPTVEAGESRQLALRWNGAPGQQFLVQVARDPAFSWLVYTSKTTAPEARFPRPAFGTYYARVQVNNPDGSASPYSAAQPFVVTDQWIIHDGNPINARSGTAR
ncbi:FecR domain-containing protein [Noviherbaspirillum sedimenti]|uniref:Peptidoglycan-binding protein n=1 Tax=Noviherbaspirillum sedimenti TaxID=2320865 RepID=A0A3A3G1F4_9BURK|nr:FecR domain-containing protein [Noviherbaspirillum sedimenti]RJG02277.1 peptidoglycan-binding protein [Noviherbaspirillum sedimenti]